MLKFKKISLLLISLISFQQHAFTIEEATIDSVQEALQKEALTCVSLVQNYIDRIKKYNLTTGINPPINAITQINPYAILEAQELDNYYQKNKKLIGNLHCVSVILKDNIDTFDTLTTAGSFSLLGNQPIKDAFLVANLRKAGAIILAKGAMDEFGWGLYGISSRTGRVGNVYNTLKNPGGSSSGVGAAISANFALVGIGTDNSGSVRIPAVFNGVNGLRPSTGLISQNGIVPMGNLDAVAGPITRTIKDMALVLEVIAKNDPLDPKTNNITRSQSYISYLEKNALNKKTIGIIRSVAGLDPFANMPTEVTDVIDKAVQQMISLGAIIVDNIHLPEFIIDRENNQAGEREDINNYLSSFPGTRKSFADICASDRTRTFGDFKNCLKFIDELPGKNTSIYQNVLQNFQSNRKYLERIMQKQNVDVLLIPIHRGVAGSYDPELINTFIMPVASNSGLPALALTVGFTKNNMPVGLELIGPFANEGILLGMAYAFQENVRPRKLPKLNIGHEKMNQLSISELNNVFTQLGATSFEMVLKNEPKLNLTGERFREIFINKMKELK